ncbi:hypothetical protein D1632_15980 [Chryseobacterium nematophagum]|uniref:Uncharacterized protein n=1 Tax=Chryseobacterium nematophagum TaxID=2305228 RepID=A0A3M7L8X8_9FLAO|nr:FISUMP domain-containing protein [Chryseobacterium nematophagum]RMZ59057.1 hypothetical protein D1632_15980 [Chryseobacterium nematophagum]
MKNKFITLKKSLPLVFVLLVSSFYGQVRISNSILNTVAPNSSAFIDASSNPEYNLSTNIGKGLLYPRTDLTTFTSFSGLPVGIPNSYPSYYDGFMLFNTATSGTAGVGATAGTLCRGFWYYDNPSNNVTGGTWRPFRPDVCSSTNPPVVTALNCSGATVTGTLTQGAVASGVSVQVPYTGGNGVAYPAGTAIPSTTVTGLTATLQAGTLANGNGTLTYTIAGTPSSAGIAHFAISFGGQNCDLQVTVAPASSPVVLNCSGATHYPLANPNIPQSLNPPLFPGTYYTIIPFTGGTGTYGSQTIPSSGQVLGLVATLRAGQMSDHQLIFDISGQTVNSGTATFVFTFQGQVCSFTREVVSLVPFQFACGNITHNGTITQGISATGVSSQIPYTGGNGVSYPSQTVSSSGVTGLTATLQAGTLANGSGLLTYNITGTPTSSGTANFTISLNGETCTFSRSVVGGDGGDTGDALVMCGSSKAWKRLNLGATSGNPDTPSAGIHGAKYQWGMSSPALTQGQDQANSMQVPGWNTSPIADGLWGPTKTINDPCPSGYRVPTSTEWSVLFQNNTVSRTGLFSNSPTNYGSAVVLTCGSNGNKLTLPAAGLRYCPYPPPAASDTGSLSARGLSGHYWSSTQTSNYSALDMYFTSQGVNPTANDVNGRNSGMSVRCIKE